MPAYPVNKYASETFSKDRDQAWDKFHAHHTPLSRDCQTCGKTFTVVNGNTMFKLQYDSDMYNMYVICPHCKQRTLVLDRDYVYTHILFFLSSCLVERSK